MTERLRASEDQTLLITPLRVPLDSHYRPALGLGARLLVLLN